MEKPLWLIASIALLAVTPGCGSSPSHGRRRGNHGDDRYPCRLPSGFAARWQSIPIPSPRARRFNNPPTIQTHRSRIRSAASSCSTCTPLRRIDIRAALDLRYITRVDASMQAPAAIGGGAVTTSGQ